MTSGRETDRRGQDDYLRVGDRIPGKNVNTLTIAQILDAGTGHLLVDKEQGNVHVYWYRWVKQGNRYSKVLAHHGGPNGFNDIQKTIDQHQRVIDKYLGVETDVKQSPQDKDEDLLTPPLSLKTYYQALKIGFDRIEIPGEKEWVGECLNLVERTIRGATIKMPASELQNRLDTLSRLQNKFSHSSNPFMQQTSIHLVRAVEAAQREDRSGTMVSLLDMEKDLNKRAQEIGEILTATIKRESILENVRNISEGLVNTVHFDVLRAKQKWDQAKNDQEREAIISAITNLMGVRRLSEFTVQPFRNRALRNPLKRLRELGEIWAQGDIDMIGKILTEGSIDLINWRAQIKKRVEGELQTRFPST